jgi:general secretion pathway protein J
VTALACPVVPAGSARGARPARLSRRARLRSQRGLTLLEILVAIAILSMMSILIYGAFDGMQRSKMGLSKVNDRYHQGRTTMRRLAQELSSAFLSMHQPYSQALIARKTIFMAKDSSPADRLDMTTFSHRRVVANARESDQNELSYFACPDPQITGKIDLCRRESPMIDLEPTKGGVVYVVAEDIDLFDVKFLDPMTGMWTDSWDSSQLIGQPNRLPLQVRITLVMKSGAGGTKPVKFEQKVPIAIFQPLTFAIPR